MGEADCGELGELGDINWTNSGGSRTGAVSKVRCELALELVKECGLTYSESARQLGVCISAIAKIIKRNQCKSN